MEETIESYEKIVELSTEEMETSDTKAQSAATTTERKSPSVTAAAKPAGKRKKCDSNAGNEGSSIADVIASLKELSRKQDETLLKVSAIEATTENTSKQMVNLTATVARLVVDVDRHGKSIKDAQSEMDKLKEENRLLKTAVAECKRYSWRWSLKLHGLKENDHEDVRKEVISILGKVAPGLQVYLEDAVDIAHRLGPKRTDGSNRPIIILFALRRILDAVWKCAKGCKFLRDNRLRLAQALSPEDRLAREKLWPLVEKARKEGKRATLIGPYALIDGKKFNHWDVK